ncbi:MAG: hypothetical protein HY323_09785 [Betaproteobacteria bacterium]|nr:hypothetical protein [Betaproteobacteria bacterium]
MFEEAVRRVFSVIWTARAVRARAASTRRARHDATVARFRLRRAAPAGRALLVVLLAGAAGCAWAQRAEPGYPARPIRFIVPLAPGGSVDMMARSVAHALTEAFGQQVVVDNRPGAGGTIAVEIAARAAPDGYTMVMGSSSTFGVNPTLYRRLGYDAIRGFAPVIFVSFAPNALVVHPPLPVRSVKAGKLRALGVTSAKRAPALPDVPSMSEAGFAAVNATSWNGILVPARTERRIVERLNREVQKMLTAAEVRERLVAQGAEPGGGTPEEFARFIRNEITKWGKVVKAAGLRVE